MLAVDVDRELLLLREMRGSTWNIDVETLVATAVDDLPQMITGLDRAITMLEDAELFDPHN